jgi:hypothetical protein
MGTINEKIKEPEPVAEMEDVGIVAGAITDGSQLRKWLEAHGLALERFDPMAEGNAINESPEISHHKNGSGFARCY